MCLFDRVEINVFDRTFVIRGVFSKSCRLIGGLWGGGEGDGCLWLSPRFIMISIMWWEISILLTHHFKIPNVFRLELIAINISNHVTWQYISLPNNCCRRLSDIFFWQLPPNLHATTPPHPTPRHSIHVYYCTTYGNQYQINQTLYWHRSIHRQIMKKHTKRNEDKLLTWVWISGLGDLGLDIWAWIYGLGYESLDIRA